MSAPDYQRWICDACGFIYDEARGDPDSGLPPGTRYEDIPDDWYCPLCGLGKSDLRLIPDAPATAGPVKRSRPSSNSRGGDEHVVIVGAGMAGWSVAEAVRRRNSSVPILLITACEGISYPKPALSTAIASGIGSAELVQQDASARAQALGMEVLTRTRVLKVDPARRRITTPKGGIRYGTLVLAVGAQQRQLPIAGDAAENVLRVNDLSAYSELRDRLDDGVRHVTVLGAGLIGCEFAEDLTSGGYGVSVVEPGDYPLASLVPAATGLRLRQQLERKGIEWRFGATIDSLEHSGGRLRATLSTGSAVETDLVLSAAGLVPNTQLAEKSGLSVGRGIATDRLMRTSAENVYAVGDCAAVEGRVFAYIEPIRRQAETVAAHLAGEERPFLLQPPLVRVKTPSYPLTVCPPAPEDFSEPYPVASSDYIEYRSGDRVVGFVLAGAEAVRAGDLYRQLYG